MRTTRRRLRCFNAWLVMGWGLVFVVVYLSLTSSPIQTPGVAYGDKIGHFAAYFVLMAWFAQLYPRKRHGLFLLLFTLLGGALELMQAATPVRMFEYADMAANGMGALSAWCLAGAPRLSNLLVQCELLVLPRAE